MVRILFEMARYYAPSVVFMDEIDAIASARGGMNEHEASRRVKTELLVQLNGVTSNPSNSQDARVILLAATNLPWELDEAMRRRLTKRVCKSFHSLCTFHGLISSSNIDIPLPDEAARRQLFQLNTAKVQVAQDVELEEFVNATKVKSLSFHNVHLLTQFTIGIQW